MKWYAHVSTVMPLLVLPSVLGFYVTTGYAMGLVAGSVLPDAVEVMFGLPHRNRVTHNIVSALLMLWFGYMVLSQTIMGLGIGYLIHLLVDATSRYGVWFLGFRVNGSLNSSSVMHNLFYVVLSLFLTLSLLLLV